MRLLIIKGLVGFAAALALMAGCREVGKVDHSAKAKDATKKHKALAGEKKQAAKEPDLVELPAASTPPFMPRDGHFKKMKMP